MSFHDLIDKVYNYESLNLTDIDPPIKKERKHLLFPIGICRSFEIEKDVWISPDKTNKFKIFITDQSMSTYFSIDLNSHKGERLRFTTADDYYNVKVGMTDSNHHDEECDSMENYSFHDCVDNFIINDLGKVI